MQMRGLENMKETNREMVRRLLGPSVSESAVGHSEDGRHRYEVVFGIYRDLERGLAETPYREPDPDRWYVPVTFRDIGEAFVHVRNMMPLEDDAVKVTRMRDGSTKFVFQSIGWAGWVTAYIRPL